MECLAAAGRTDGLVAPPSTRDGAVWSGLRWKDPENAAERDVSFPPGWSESRATCGLEVRFTDRGGNGRRGRFGDSGQL